MLSTVRKSAAAVVAVGALGLGGAAIAGAADTHRQGSHRVGPPAARSPLQHVAAKVKAAALAKVPGATVLRTEAGGPYTRVPRPHQDLGRHAKVVLVNGSFEATAVQADRPRRQGQGRPPRRPGGRARRDRADR